MGKALKSILIALIFVVPVVAILWLPYRTETVPEWKVQVLDESGRPVAGAQANEEWIDPIEDGKIGSDSRDTDSEGWVVFPRRDTRNRLAIRLLNR